MPKLFLRDVGSRPGRPLEVTLFKDGELQFEADNGKYVHINIPRASVKELLDFLLEEIRPITEGIDETNVCLKCQSETVGRHATYGVLVDMLKVLSTKHVVDEIYWLCPKCKIPNVSQRLTCYVCETPRN